MSDVPPPKNAFDVLMVAEKDPWYTAVLYEAHLEHADQEEPLWRVPYFGQIVRQGTAEEIFEVRKRAHETDASREDKDLGFHAVIDRFGAKAIVWRIVSFKSGPRSEMQAWANAEEIRLIGAHGGILRDMDTKLEQTLNLTKGGQWGDARARWAGIDARRRCAFNRFKAVMEKYVEKWHSALVPREFVVDEYPLGVRLGSFRKGETWKGAPWENEATAWAQALPEWHWNARESDEWRENLAQRGQERSREAFAKFKTAMEKYVKEKDSALVPYAYVDADKYPLGVALNSFRQGQMRKGMPWEGDAAVWAQALPKWEWNSRNSVEWRESQAPGAKKKRAEERCNEIEFARLIAVPFERSKKRRAEMRAVSKHVKPLGCGKSTGNVLYMVSEDGETIRRVNNQGNMGKDLIVGPLVDPPPIDAYDSEAV